MKQHIKDFLMRGMMFSVGGPLIAAVVYQSIGADAITGEEFCFIVFSSALLAFIAGGISVIYNIEKLPLMTASFLHALVLYADYIVVYLMNGWIPMELVPLFTLCFVIGYLIIWLLVWLCIRARVKRVNKAL